MFRGGRGRGSRGRGWHQGRPYGSDRKNNYRDHKDGKHGGHGEHSEHENHRGRGNHHGNHGHRGNQRGGQRGRGSKDWNSTSRHHGQRHQHEKQGAFAPPDYSLVCEHFLRGGCSAGDDCLYSHLVQPVYTSALGPEEPIVAITVIEVSNMIVCATRKSIFLYQSTSTGFKEYLCFPVDGEVTAVVVLQGEAYVEAMAEAAPVCTLFVAVARPASPMGDSRHATIVPVGTIQAWDFQYPCVDPVTRQDMPTVHPSLDPSSPIAHRHPITVMAGILNASPAVPALLASGAGDGTVKVWTPIAGGMRAAAVLNGEDGHVRAITALQFYQEPQVVRLISGSADGAVKVWNLSSLLPDVQGPGVRPSSSMQGVHLTATLAAPFTSVLHSTPRTATLGMSQFARAALLHAAHTSPATGESDVAVVGMEWVNLEQFREPVDAWILLVAYRGGHMRVWDMDTPDTPRLLTDHHAILTPDSGDKLLHMTVQDLNESYNCGPAVLAVYESGRIVAREIADAGLSDEQGRDQKSFTIPCGKKKEHQHQHGGGGHASPVTALAAASNNCFLSGDGDGKLIVWKLLPMG